MIPEYAVWELINIHEGGLDGSGVRVVGWRDGVCGERGGGVWGEKER